MNASVEMVSAATLLDLWERGEGRSPAGRATALVAAFSPDLTDEALAALSVGQREHRLLLLRARLFGSIVTGLIACPHCGVRVEIQFDSRELQPGTASAPIGDFDLTVGEVELRCRLPSSADLDAIANFDDVDAARTALLMRCVAARDATGAPIPVTVLPDELIDAVAAEMDRIDPLADVQLPVECPSCAGVWQAGFDAQSFLWTELRAWAHRTLGDVHVLASAYGWSEADILALSPTRRRRYLELVAR